jgi:hypothetical protein
MLVLLLLLHRGATVHLTLGVQYTQHPTANVHYCFDVCSGRHTSGRRNSAHRPQTVHKHRRNSRVIDCSSEQLELYLDFRSMLCIMYHLYQCDSLQHLFYHCTCHTADTAVMSDAQDVVPTLLTHENPLWERDGLHGTAVNETLSQCMLR